MAHEAWFETEAALFIGGPAHLKTLRVNSIDKNYSISENGNIFSYERRNYLIEGNKVGFIFILLPKNEVLNNLEKELKQFCKINGISLFASDCGPDFPPTITMRVEGLYKHIGNILNN